MKKQSIYSMKGFLSSFVAGFFMLYLSLISFYLINHSLKLKTLNNLEKYYDLQIEKHIQKEDFIHE